MPSIFQGRDSLKSHQQDKETPKQQKTRQREPNSIEIQLKTAFSEWKADFHVSFRGSMGTKPGPKLAQTRPTLAQMIKHRSTSARHVNICQH